MLASKQNKRIVLILLLRLSTAYSTVFTVEAGNLRKYEPTWESLDKRPLPNWYDEAKFGIFLHWGVFSVPSFGSEWFWYNWNANKPGYVEYMQKNYPPGFTYQDFARDFTAEFFDPKEWAHIFQKSGARYVVLTSKHHEGFTLWPSQYSFSWNAHDIGPHRDLVGDLATAIRNLTDIHFGLYHSFFEWFNPMYLADEAANFSRNNFVVRKVYPEMMELVEAYKPEVFWSDGAGEVPVEYWQSREFLTWLYNESPVKDVVVVNDRWGKDTSCRHGGFYSCRDRYDPGVLQPHKWENAMTIDKSSWGFRRNAGIEDYLTSQELILLLAKTVSCGGNLLINVGPTKEGTIAPIFQERLHDMGTWLSLNGEAIYKTVPWTSQNDSVNPTVWYTSSSTFVYALVLEWPSKNVLELGSVLDLFNKNPKISVTLLENGNTLKWNIESNKVGISLGDKASTKNEWAWVIKIANFKNKSKHSLDQNGMQVKASSINKNK